MSAEERSAVEDRADRIVEELASGPRPAREAEAVLTRNGYSKATQRRARERAGVTRQAGTLYREKFG